MRKVGRIKHQSPLTTRRLGRSSSALRMAACHFPGRSSKLSASSSASWNSGRSVASIDRRLGVVPERVVHPGLLGGWWLLKPQFQGGRRMRLHANAALTLSQRRRMVRLVVDEKWPVSAAAAEFNTSARTCSKWVARYREASRERAVGSQLGVSFSGQPHR